MNYSSSTHYTLIQLTCNLKLLFNYFRKLYRYSLHLHFLCCSLEKINEYVGTTLGTMKSEVDRSSLEYLWLEPYETIRAFSFVHNHYFSIAFIDCK